MIRNTFAGNIIATMNTAMLISGSNEGDRQAQLRQARQLLEQEAGELLRYSGVYETAAWGREDMPPHLNQVLVLATPLDALTLLHKIHLIESRLGRTRQERWGLRTIDIDILFFNQDILRQDMLQIPHPRLQDRRFVLIPLAEVAPDFIHPGLKKSITTLLQECKDNLSVELVREIL